MADFEQGIADTDGGEDPQAMEYVKATWRNNKGERVEFTADLSLTARADLIKFMEANDGNDEYMAGEWV